MLMFRERVNKMLSFFKGGRVKKDKMIIPLIPLRDIIIFPAVSLLKIRIIFVPIKEPTSEKAMPEAATFQTTFFFRIKLISAVPVPTEEANLFVPRATWGGNPASIMEGTSRRPPPPAILSINPARKETDDKIIVIVVLSKFKIILSCCMHAYPYPTT